MANMKNPTLFEVSGKSSIWTVENYNINNTMIIADKAVDAIQGPLPKSGLVNALILHNEPITINNPKIVNAVIRL